MPTEQGADQDDGQDNGKVQPVGPHSIFSFTTRRPVGVVMMVLAAVVFGLVGLNRLPVDLLPDISYPSLTIRTEYPGASPEDVEERVSERLQESVSVVSGVRRVTSISRPGISDIILEFSWDTQMVFAISDVRERIERVYLPDAAERPLVLRYDPSLDPILTIGLSGEMDMVELRRIAEEEIERDITKIDGIAAVKIRGGDEEEIRIAVDEKALDVLGIDVQVLGQRLSAENVNTAAGSIDEGNTEFLVRTLGEFRNIQEIEALIIERRNGSAILLSDVAKITRVPQDKEVVSRVNGKPCVLVDVYKEAGANIVDLAERVRNRTFGTARQKAYTASIVKDPSLIPESFRKRKPGDPSFRRKRSEAVAVEASGDSTESGDAKDAEKKHNKEKAMAARMKRMQAEKVYRSGTNYLSCQMQPHGVQVDLLQDQSKFIETSIDDVKSSALLGGLFAIIVIFLFLRRFSATVILAVSIPISLIASFAPMFLSQISLNIMSLGGLALGVGMLVDNSIVVLESITRMREQGMSIRDAAVTGVSRVASAVIASTLTTVAVFFPIVFVEGVAGQLFRDQALAVVYSLLMSLVVALFVIPMLASRGAGGLRETLEPGSGFGRITQNAASSVMRLFVYIAGFFGKLVGLAFHWTIGLVFDFLYRQVERIYPHILHGALAARWLVILVALGLLGFAAQRATQLGSEMIPEVSQGEIYVDVFLPRDATVERTDAVVTPLEMQIAQLPNVTHTFVAVGVDKNELNSSEEGEHSARILVRLETHGNAKAVEDDLRESVRAILKRMPELSYSRISRPSILSFSAPLVVEVVGRDLLALRQVSRDVEKAMDKVPGLQDVRSTLQRGNPEIVIRLDREKMSSLEIDSGIVARILKSKIEGDMPTRFAERERKIDMRVRLDREDLSTVKRLLEVNVNPKGFPSIPLSSIAFIQRLEGPSEIRRLGNNRGAEVQAAVAGFDIGSTQARVEDAIAQVHRPEGIEVRLGGQKEEMQRSMNSLVMAMLLAIFLVYIVMASQFESLIQPIIILASLPLALVGVILLLDVTNTPISVIVLLGGIVLAGIVVNNAIILVDQINAFRAQGVPKMQAIADGARTRLRPVLMTTMTTVLGLIPLTGWLVGIPVLGGTGEGLELRAPLAITVIAGLSTSTLLTLIVIPVAYSLSDRRA